MTFFTFIALAVILSLCLQCIPVQGIWDRSVNAHCLSPVITTRINEASGGQYSTKMSSSVIAYLRTAISVVMDVLCVLLPILVYRKLQIDWRDKLAVFIILGLGLLLDSTNIFALRSF